MTIISTFFKTRTEARNAKVDLGGKVIDNGSTAEAGKRWELQYESAPKTEVIKALAEFIAAEVLDVKAVQVEPRDLMGLPRPVSNRTTVRGYTLKDRKGHPVQVQVRRSRTSAMLAAHLAKS